MTPATTTSGSTLQNATICPPELQPRDREFIRSLCETNVNDLNTHEDKQAFFEKMIKIATTGVSIEHKQFETSMVVFTAAQNLALATVGLITAETVNRNLWNGITNGWEALAVFNQHLDRYELPIKGGIAKVAGLREALEAKQFPSNLKRTIEGLS